MKLDSKVGRRLYQVLLEEGYIPLLEALDTRRYPQYFVESGLFCCSDTLKAACELLCLGKTVELKRLSYDLRQVIKEIVPSGIVRIDCGRATIAPLALYVLQGLLYFAEMPNPLITVYFGEDSIALASRLNINNPKRGCVLDICSGPGIQGLLSASYGHEVTAVEINPIALSVAECNAVLNGCIDRYHTVLQSAKDFLQENQSKQYDKIFANPPLVPIPDEYSYQFVGAGGVDGLLLTKTIVNLASKMLNTDGELVTIGVSGGDEIGPYILDVLDKIMVQENLKCTLVILRKNEIACNSEWLDTIARSLMNYSFDKKLPNMGILQQSYLKNNVSFVYFFALSIVATSEESQNLSRSKLKILDFSFLNNGRSAWWIS